MHKLIDVKATIMKAGLGKYRCSGTIAYEAHNNIFEIDVTALADLHTTSDLSSAQVEEILLKWIEVAQSLEKTEGSHKRLVALGD